MFVILATALRWLFKPRQTGIVAKLTWKPTDEGPWHHDAFFIADGQKLCPPHISTGPGRVVSAYAKDSNGIAIRVFYDFGEIGPFDLLWAEVVTADCGVRSVFIHRRVGVKVA